MSINLCPADGQPCCDDLCHGGGCIALGDGYEMLSTCDACGGTVDSTIPECSTCSCEPDDDYPDDED